MMHLPKIKFKIGHAVLFAIAAGLMAVNGTLLYSMQKKVDSEKQAVEEAIRPAELELTILSAPSCAECFDIQNLVAPLRQNEKVRITKEQTIEYTTPAGSALLAKYAVTRLPTVLVSGDVAKAFDVASFTQNLGRTADDGTLIVTNLPPPYLDPANGKVHGKFTLTFLTDKGCQGCYDPTLHRNALAGLAMKPAEEKFVDRLDSDGQRLVAKYKIASAPTILLQGELQEYPQFKQVWTAVGTVEGDGTHVFRAGQALMGAYHDLKTGKIVEPKTPEPTPNPASAAPSP